MCESRTDLVELESELGTENSRGAATYESTRLLFVSPMSLAGVRSFRGDEYQFQVALDWTVRLLTDDDVLSVQAESLGAVGDAPPMVDDVVVRLADRTVYVQAKKNHPKRGVWSLRDSVLQAELVKACDQLDEDARGEAWIYSQSPFGELEQLCDEARYFPDYDSFVSKAPATLGEALGRFAGVVERDQPSAFGLVRRVRTKRTLDFDDWERAVLRDLRARFARPDDVADLLVRLLARQHARLGGGPLVDPGAPVTRLDLETLLRKRGHVRTPQRPEAEMRAAFARASRRGRVWKRDVDGRQFVRHEVEEIATALTGGARSVVVTSGPGGGKTCVLLDLVDRLEADDEWAVLFIKGDQYEGARTLSDLVDRGLPDDLVGQASRLSVGCRVAVVVDALDVLSLQRASGTLALFLGLLDEIATVEGVAVVAACRDFDLTYAPELRDRTWGHRVSVGLLLPETVDDVLRGWGLDPNALDASLREHLRVPQHLRLFGQVVEGGGTDVAAGPYALHDRFLDVVVEQASGLGAPAMGVLYEVADRLQRERRLTLPRSAFPADPALVERLLSAEVLIEPQPGLLSFSHQEILDCVAVRGAVRRGETLLDYLSARPALPFLRPTARTFLFMLRAKDPEDFRRQARRAMDADRLAYHLRRLIAESIAEVVPEVDDRRLLRFLMRRHPDLFERLAGRLRDRAWLEHVRALLDDVRESADADRWTVRLLTLLNTWAGEEPEAVVGAWREALDGRWEGVAEAHWGVSTAIRAALKATLEGERPSAVIGDTIRLLLDLPDPHRHLTYDLAGMVQGWVEAVDGDDDLVRRVLERDAETDRDERTSRDFKGAFLEDRLVASDGLMEWAYGKLRQSAETHAPPRWSDLLHATSYRGRHARGMMAAGDGRYMLAGPFERALVRRAVRGDAWWLAHASELRGHDDWGFLFLAMRGYEAAPARHARSVARLIADPEVLGRWSLKSEVRELAYAAYPFLADDEREAHQRAVLDLYERDDERGRWRARAVYEHLVWVPRVWQTPEAQAFVRAWERAFGPWRPAPEITSSGGFVAPPFSSDQLLALSDEGVLRLALYFGTEVTGWETRIEDGVGGWDQAVGSFRDAASRAPLRMAALLPRLLAEGVAPPYPDALVDGLGMFLRLRFGNLTSGSGWTAVEEHQDGESLGRMVLRLLERFGDSGFRGGTSETPTWQQDGAPWLSEHTVAGAVRGCEAVLRVPDDLARLTLLVLRLSRSSDPEPGEGRSAASVALNSVRGEAAEAAIQIAGSLLADGAPLPPLLRPLLFRLATDPIAGVRWSVMRGLPYLTQFDGELGWALAERALAAHDSEVWEAAERLFYHNYSHDFPRVAPYLGALRESGLVPETYGRIAMLSALSGHVDAESFVGALGGQPDGVWKGAAQVLIANLVSDRSREACIPLLHRLLSEPGIPDAAVQAVVYGMEDEVRPHVPRSVIDRLMELRDDEDGFRWTRVAEWIEAEAVRDPASAAEALGRLAAAVERSTPRGFYGSREELGRALNAVLRDADESDDPVFIRTAVELQDTLTRRGLIDADALFEASARP